MYPDWSPPPLSPPPLSPSSRPFPPWLPSSPQLLQPLLPSLPPFQPLPPPFQPWLPPFQPLPPPSLPSSPQLLRPLPPWLPPWLPPSQPLLSPSLPPFQPSLPPWLPPSHAIPPPRFLPWPAWLPPYRLWAPPFRYSCSPSPFSALPTWYLWSHRSAHPPCLVLHLLHRYPSWWLLERFGSIHSPMSCTHWWAWRSSLPSSTWCFRHSRTTYPIPHPMGLHHLRFPPTLRSFWSFWSFFLLRGSLAWLPLLHLHASHQHKWHHLTRLERWPFPATESVPSRSSGELPIQCLPHHHRLVPSSQSMPLPLRGELRWETLLLGWSIC